MPRACRPARRWPWIAWCFRSASPRRSHAHPLHHHRARRGAARCPAPGGWSPVIVATGPLTSDALSADIRAFVGADHLYFYDAISPIVLAETIDMAKVFRASRWDRSLRRCDGCARCGRCAKCECRSRAQCRCAAASMMGEGDYLNCPLTKDEYEAFYQARDRRPNRRRFTTSTRRSSSRAVCRSR